VDQDTVFPQMRSLRIGSQLLELDQVRIFGILNLSPDSFFEGSRVPETGLAIERAGKMLEEGADILDLGGMSTRPGAEEISAQEETDRLIPVVEALHKAYPQAILSADTYRADVARKAVAAGASVINDVSGGNLDSDMFRTVAELGVTYVLTHMRGTPKTMNDLAHYESVTKDVIRDLTAKPKSFAKWACTTFYWIRELVCKKRST
jgi:dihydropteroate synthase